MVNQSVSVYFGQEREDIFTGFSAENDFYTILTAEEGLDKVTGAEFLKGLNRDIHEHHIEHLADFEHFLIEKLKTAGIPTHSSLACLLISGETCFLKTMGEGIIYLRRHDKFARLIEGNKSASGIVEPEDLFIFTTQTFNQKVMTEKELHHTVRHKTPLEIRDALTPIGKAQDDTGVIALFLEVKKKEEEFIENVPIESEEAVVAPDEPVFKTNKIKELWVSAKAQYAQWGRKKIATFAAVIILFFIFLWSVVFGYQRRSNAKLEKDIQIKKEIITENLTQAEEVVFLNVSRAQALIASSKTELAELKKEAGNKKKKEIKELEDLIANKEGKIFNKEERATEEFFDVAVDNPDVHGKKLALGGENLAILDPANGLYILSLSKKSLNKQNPKELKKASLVGRSEDASFILTPDGMIQITDKAKKIINHDKEWGTIGDFALFSKNIYLLDTEKNQIYKYTPTEDGYSNKSMYIKSGQGKILRNATSLAIDSSVYISQGKEVIKYTAGDSENFNTSFPEDDVQLHKIVTNKDLEKIYAWDKNKGVIYILNKTGSYERQVRSSLLTKADDLVIFDEQVYFLIGSKIHRMSVK